jgi:AcrR family transcriptional regulator
MKRRAKIDPTAILTATLADTTPDDTDVRVLDAAESWLRETGLRRWSIDDVAARSDVGRTSIYRRFGDRDTLVHAVLARELRTTLHRMRDAMDAEDDLESKAVAAVSAALRELDGSVSDALLRSDPETFLPFLTTEAGPLLAIARTAITQQMTAYVDDPSPELAEAAARFGLSFILTRDTVLPLHDEDQLAHAVRTMIRPFIAALGADTEAPP